MIDYDVLFCFVDDFCKAFSDWWQKTLLQASPGKVTRNRSTHLHLSEIITIMLAYHESGYRCFKDYYRFVLLHHRKEFPHLVSYDRFVSLMKRTFGILIMLFAALRGKPTDIMFVDSTPYAVCKAVRRYNHKVFKGIAALSKNSVGWFYGLRLHFLFNDKGEIVRLRITPGNVDDRVPVPQLGVGHVGIAFEGLHLLWYRYLVPYGGRLVRFVMVGPCRGGTAGKQQRRKAYSLGYSLHSSSPSFFAILY